MGDHIGGCGNHRSILGWVDRFARRWLLSRRLCIWIWNIRRCNDRFCFLSNGLERNGDDPLMARRVRSWSLNKKVEAEWARRQRPTRP